MIDGSEKRNRQLAFELQNSHVCEKRSKCALGVKQPVINKNIDRAKLKNFKVSRDWLLPNRFLLSIAINELYHDAIGSLSVWLAYCRVLYTL